MIKTVYVTVEALIKLFNENYGMRLPKNTRFILTSEINKEKEQSYIADLQSQLAEKEEQCRDCKHLNKKIELNIKNKLMAENSELQKQLAESEKRIQAYEEIVERKDKEISFANRDKTCIVKQLNDPKAYVLLEDYKEQYFKVNQDKISFAVEQLEKVKETLIQNADEIGDEYKEDYFMISLGNVKNIIDNQIKAIKEMR